MSGRKRRKKQIRNLIYINYSILKLVLVVVAFNLLGGALKTLVSTKPAEEVTGDIILNDEPEPVEEERLVVCIDAGHGGKDNGSDYRNRRFEKDDNLKYAKAVAAYLEGKGIEVVMTRDDDEFLSLEERCKIANESGADYFVSLHRNDGDGNGVELWVASNPTDETMAFAEGILENLDKVGIQRNRGVKKGTQKSSSGNYYINLNSDMPSCIVEMGFIGNTTDNQLLDEKLEAYAAGIGDAVIAAYEIYGGAAGTQNTADTPSAGAGTEGTENTENTSGAGGYTTTQIDLNGLDTTNMDWGQGVNVDDENRPVGAITAQEKYGQRNALFIGENTKTIYLTFDEGYEYGFTESILNTLKEKGVHAVFFVTEPYAKSDPELVQRIIDEGHTLGNHSVTHPAAGLTSLTVEAQQQEVLGCHEYIKENFGYEMHLFRYPAGKFSEQSLAVVNNCGYKSVFWSFAYLDYDVNNQPAHAESLKKMTDKLHPGAVYLLHAESETNAAVLGDFIDKVREAGYGFGVVE